MKFCESWLREWMDPGLETEALSAQLTLAGLEVDALEPVAPSYHGVVVGEIVEVAPHPDADRLRVTQVNVGVDKPVQIVTNVADVAVGQRVPVAMIGAELPGKDDAAIQRLDAIGRQIGPQVGRVVELALARLAGLGRVSLDSQAVGLVGEESRDLDLQLVALVDSFRRYLAASQLVAVEIEAIVKVAP